MFLLEINRIYTRANSTISGSPERLFATSQALCSRARIYERRANRTSIFQTLLRIPINLNLQVFGRWLCRRGYDRFNIPGSNVSWVVTGQSSFPDETSPLSDISRSGLALLTNNPPTVGSEITLHISPPQKAETLDMLGRVIYSIPRGPGLTYRYRIGVKFIPGAPGDACNSLQSANMIEALEQRYRKRGSQG
jgi:hypothetical protein